MTTRGFSPAAALRLADEIDALGDRVWLTSEDLLAEAARLKQEAEALRAVIAEEQELEAAREYAGPTLMVRRSA